MAPKKDDKKAAPKKAAGSGGGKAKKKVRAKLPGKHAEGTRRAAVAAVPLALMRRGRVGVLGVTRQSRT